MLKSSNQIVVTGIGTDVGKTVVSAIVAEALKATYWKPVQAGDLENSDSIKISKLTSNVEVLPEAFRLTKPMSPHAAATRDGIEINPTDLEIPDVSENLVIEGAGGLMVPINSNGYTYADLFQRWNLPVVIVSRHYLGSINHTILTIEVLKSRDIPILGLIFVGDENQETESIILKSTQVKMIARIPEVEQVNAEFVQEQSKRPELIYGFK